MNSHNIWCSMTFDAKNIAVQRLRRVSMSSGQVDSESNYKGIDWENQKQLFHFLPLAYKVRPNIMFSQVCVCPQGGSLDLWASGPGPFQGSPIQLQIKCTQLSRHWYSIEVSPRPVGGRVPAPPRSNRLPLSQWSFLVNMKKLHLFHLESTLQFSPD